MRIRPTADPDFTAEIASQRQFLGKFEATRILATLLSCVMMAAFLPIWIVLLFLGVDYLFEVAGYRLMQGLDPAQHRTRYRATLLCVFLMEAVYLVPVALIWQQDTAFAKAMAVGLVCMTLFQLATVRAIHLPFGVAGTLGVMTTTAVANTVYWLHRGDAVGFAASIIAAAGAAFYSFSAMGSNHALHREIKLRGQKADLASQVKSQFLAQMSHELRTPLNAILGMGEAELADTDLPRTQDRMRTLVASAQGLAVILDDVLDMSAIGENALPIRLQPVDPQSVITATAALFQPLFAAANLSLSVHSQPNLQNRLLLDPHRLRQCLSNLLSNALKHTGAGGVTVSSRLPANAVLEIDVTDTGPGVAEADRAVIFEPFNRGSGGQIGTGLGLPISRGLARQMGGDLVLLPSSTGARFRLTIAVSTAPPASLPEARLAQTMNALAGLRILAVDDIATNRLIACTYLRLHGAIAQEAESGTAAVAILRAEPTDLVLLDMNMPGLSGLQTVAAIRALTGQAGRVKVLAMTADASESHRLHYLAMGLDGFLAKPLTAKSVLAAVTSALDLTAASV